MTVAPSITWDAAPQQQQQRRPKSWPAKKEAAGTGVQVVAVLFAVRIGFKLARTLAGRILLEATTTTASPSVSEGTEEQLGSFSRNEAGEYSSSDGSSDGSAQGVSARDQWVLCPGPLPQAPEDARLMASEHLPISVYHFYEQYLSVETTCLQDHHRSTGQFNFTHTTWRPAAAAASDDSDTDSSSSSSTSSQDEEAATAAAAAAAAAGVLTRTFEFMQPKKGVCSANARCVQQQRLSVHAGGVLSLTTDMRTAGIPYADAFRVQSFWKAAPDATGLGCHVSVHVAVPFVKRCLVRGLIQSTTFKDCQGFYSDFLAKVQNSIATELLPAAAAQAAAAEQLLGTSPQAAAAALNSHLPQPPPLTLRTAADASSSPSHRRQQQRVAGSSANTSSSSSPFAAVDAEVFVSTPMQAGGNAPQRKHSSNSGSGKAGGHGWFPWPHKQQQQQQHHHRKQQHGGRADAAAAQAGSGSGGAGMLSVLGQQQQPGSEQQQWPALPSPSPQRSHQHSRSPSRAHNHTPAGSGALQQPHQQHHHQHTASSSSRPPSRAVSVKPSFALPIDDLRLPNRLRPAEVITTAQAILLLVVLVVQIISLYDNMAVRRLLAAAAAGAGCGGGAGGVGGLLQQP